MAELSTLARPYAKAAFDIANEQSKLDDWSTAISSLAEAVSVDEVEKALSQPSLSDEQKSEIIIEVLGNQLSNDEMKNFVRILGENNKLAISESISEQYELLKNEAEGTLQAEIITAMPIDEDRQKQFVEALSKRFNKKVTLDIQVNDELIGGAIIRAGDLVIDGTVNGRLAQLENTLN